MLSRIPNKKENKFYKFLYLPYFIILILFILIPIFIIFLYSIQESNKNSLFNISFTLKYYKDFYTTKVFIYVLFRSILIAIISTFFILLITYPLAYIVSKYITPIQSILILFINGTIWINMILKIQSLMQIFF